MTILAIVSLTALCVALAGLLVWERRRTAASETALRRAEETATGYRAALEAERTHRARLYEDGLAEGYHRAAREQATERRKAQQAALDQLVRYN